MKVNEVKRGQFIDLEGDLCQVVGINHVKPGKGPAYFQLDIKNIKRGSVRTIRFTSGDELDDVFVETKPVQYLYKDGDNHVFMDQKTYEQYSMPEKEISDLLPYMPFNAEVRMALSGEGHPLYIELPASMVLEVVETPPGARGDTVTNVQKAATLETGLEIKVPLHVKTGDKVKVDTRSGSFIERA